MRNKNFDFWFSVIFSVIMYLIVVFNTTIKNTIPRSLLIFIPLVFLSVIYGFKTGFFKIVYETQKERALQKEKEDEKRLLEYEKQRKREEELKSKKEKLFKNIKTISPIAPMNSDSKIKEVRILQEEFSNVHKPVPFSIEIDNAVMLGMKLALGFWLFSLILWIILVLFFGATITKILSLF